MTTHISLQNLSERIPSAPWTLKGRALIVVGRLPSTSVKKLRQGARKVLAAPGIGNIATLAIIQYDDTPVGPYQELFVCPGILWHYIPTFHVSHMFVDSDRSLLAGRALWGLPKEYAQFSIHWQPSEITAAITGEDHQPLLTVNAAGTGAAPPLLLPPLPFITVRGPRYQLFMINGLLRKNYRVKIHLDADATSPLYPILPILRNPHIALRVESFQMKIAPAFDVL